MMCKVFLPILLSFLLITQSEGGTFEHYKEKSYSFFDVNWDSAYFYALKAHDAAISDGNDYGIAQSLFMMADVDDIRRNYDKAIPVYLLALDKFSGLPGHSKSDKKRAQILHNIGRVYYLHHKYDDAISFYEQGVEICSNSDLLNLRLDILQNIAVTYKKKGDLAKSAEIQFERLTLFKKDDKHRLSNAYNHLGLVYIKLNEQEQALTYFDKILQLEQDHKFSRNRAMAYHNIANVHMSQNQLKKSEEYFELAIQENLGLKNKKGLFKNYLDITQLYMDMDEISKAEVAANHAINLKDEVLMDIENNKIYHFLSEVYFIQNKPEIAKQYFDTYVANMEELYGYQKNLAAQGDRYKIDLIASTYFNKLAEKEKFNYYIYGIIGVSVLTLLLLGIFIYQRKRKAAAVRLLREHFSSLTFSLKSD